MTYDKRFDGRSADQLRPMEAKVGVVARATGSAMFYSRRIAAVNLLAIYRDCHDVVCQRLPEMIIVCPRNSENRC